MSSRIALRTFYTALLMGLACYATPGLARHGEGNILTNRIPEPAPYVVEETTANTALGGPAGAFAPPPFENLWTSTNDINGCDGCHTGLYDQWNGSMMANAWRDPGWRGAFLLVARLTSTDGCNDITPVLSGGLARDGSLGYDCSTAARKLNPFANADGTSTFDMGSALATYSGSGSLMDDFCSRCHMPTNYVDATTGVTLDAPSNMEHGAISPTFDPTAINAAAPVATSDPVYGATRESFAERLDGNRPVNSNSGQIGIVCEVCHTNVASRYTPYHLYNKTESGGQKEYWAATLNVGRWDPAQRDQFGQPLPANHQDMLTPPDINSMNLGYAVAAGSFRLSPHALNWPERFGPLSWNDFTGTVDTYLTDVFAGGAKVDGSVISPSNPLYFVQAKPPGKHDTFYQVKFERAEFCGSCHDVTNPATIKNQFGKWVGGFPIERTYTEYLNSRYADRPGNVNFDPNYKRDCQTCHMQQSFGQPGSALTLYRVEGGVVTPDIAPNDPLDNRAALSEPSCDRVTHNPGYSHHFVGGNAYITKMIGADVDAGTVTPYPELLETSFSSKDDTSRLHYARFDITPARRGPAATQHERFAWDRLRNALSMTLTAPASIARPSTETVVGLSGVITNAGSGHNFPTGFPEGRVAWVRVAAWDTRNGTVASPYDLVNGVQSAELMIQDSANGNRRSLGVGYLTDTAMLDPTFPASCNWNIPEGSPDPYALTFKAVASLDGTCPTLDLPYATPLNLVVNAQGMPIDAGGTVIDRSNPTGIPQYTDERSGSGIPNDGDLFDSSFLKDTRLQPMKGTSNPHATASLARYSVVVPATLPSGLTLVGPVAITATVYYQSFESIVAKKFLGNLANLDDPDSDEGYPTGSPTVETCVLKGICDRINKTGATGEIQLRDALKLDPVVVDGAPPVPVVVKNQVIQISGTVDNVAPRVMINNYKDASGNFTNMTAAIPFNRHWSPSPYGGATGNYATEGIGEQNVDPARIVKISFSEPVTGVDMNTFYLTDSRGRSVPALLNQIDDTTWALFPYTSTDQTFLSASTNIIHVAPSRNGSAIRDFAGNALTPGPTTTPAGDAGQYTFGFKIM